MTSPAAATPQARLDEIRERHVRSWHVYPQKLCHEDRQPWPCDTVVALQENERLRGALEGLGGPGGLHIFRHVDLEEFCPVCGFPAWTHDPATAFLFSQQPARSSLGAPETREGEKP